MWMEKLVSWCEKLVKTPDMEKTNILVLFDYWSKTTF